MSECKSLAIALLKISLCFFGHAIIAYRTQQADLYHANDSASATFENPLLAAVGRERIADQFALTAM